MKGVSQRAYARMRGVAMSAVQKAIKTKRITPNEDGTIDPERANQEWLRNTFAGHTLHRVASPQVVPLRTAAPPRGGSGMPGQSESARTPNQYTWGSMCFLETRQPVLRFDTNGLGTILSASLTIYVSANEINQSTSGKTFYLKQKTTYPPVFADIYPYIDFSSGVTMGTSSMTSGWSGTGSRTIPLSNPDADINKSSSTYILLGHNIPAACGGCNSRILIDSYQMTNKPHLSLTLAGGARIIVVAEQ